MPNLDEIKVPKGIVGVFTNPTGKVVASVSIFERAKPAGFRLREMQEIRAREQLAFEVANTYCSPVFVQGIDKYDFEKIMNKMCNNGYSATYIPIGYEEEHPNDHD